MHPELTLVGLYALQGAVLDVHWNSLPPDMKDELRTQVAEWL
ncbi:MAG: TfoX/Sxy family DNA transformation protein [bacterium]|nr:TfoX/Sxy family DNA transformation protein [bacterium]